MGVEAFVYQVLNRPGLTISGEVLSDPAGAEAVDWIALSDEQEEDDAGERRSPPFFLRGGCDLAAIDHYARMVSSEVEGEYNLVRDGIHIRLDHSLLTRYAIDGVPDDAAAAFYRLGYAREDFRSPLFAQRRPGRWVLSLLADLWVALYRHNATGALIPFLGAPGNGLLNLLELSDTERQKIVANPSIRVALETLAGEFSYVGRIPEPVFKANIEAILRAIPDGSETFVILHKEFFGQDDRPETRAKAAIQFNRCMRDVAEGFPVSHACRWRILSNLGPTFTRTITSIAWCIIGCSNTSTEPPRDRTARRRLPRVQRTALPGPSAFKSASREQLDRSEAARRPDQARKAR